MAYPLAGDTVDEYLAGKGKGVLYVTVQYSVLIVSFE
jgi:hypothetical protein